MTPPAAQSTGADVSTAFAEEIAAAAESLKSQSTDLVHRVASFKVGDVSRSAAAA